MDGKVYCILQGLVKFWVYDDSHGKRMVALINWKIYGIYVSHGFWRACSSFQPQRNNMKGLTQERNHIHVSSVRNHLHHSVFTTITGSQFTERCCLGILKNSRASSVRLVIKSLLWGHLYALTSLFTQVIHLCCPQVFFDLKYLLLVRALRSQNSSLIKCFQVNGKIWIYQLLRTINILSPKRNTLHGKLHFFLWTV